MRWTIGLIKFAWAELVLSIHIRIELYNDLQEVHFTLLRMIG